ncbi:6-pyruvoyl tetrahydrobiopterin synthase isoform X1 [Hydra vulgaris]|uniref:6-pyruvoyl tetrahydrobiopterin synthase isoform X1 n=1 Tax=Hydra vulgaris TaxID=6087 RepID=UPI001F5F6D0E|nr:6-pyruvoyl tetrahydrobiopterin synthase [Hydra vulgaris]
MEKSMLNTQQPYVYLTRSEFVSCSHRLHSCLLSEEENLKIYGKCNNKNGHGHNYKIKVTLYGPIKEETGMVMNLTTLRDYMKVCVVDALDHKNLDMDVPWFKNKVSTAENLVVFIWNSLKLVMDEPQLLYEVKVQETDKNVAFYRGRNSYLN